MITDRTSHHHLRHGHWQSQVWTLKACYPAAAWIAALFRNMINIFLMELNLQSIAAYFCLHWMQQIYGTGWFFKHHITMAVIYLDNAALVFGIMSGNPSLECSHCLPTPSPALLLSLPFFMLPINHITLPNHHIRWQWMNVKTRHGILLWRFANVTHIIYCNVTWHTGESDGPLIANFLQRYQLNISVFPLLLSIITLTSPLLPCLKTIMGKNDLFTAI